MEFEWDDGKVESNLRKHGVRFEDAIYMFEGCTIERPDPRRYGDEVRYIAFGILDGRLLAIVYTWRGDYRRIISARKANNREQRAYHAALLERSPDTAG